MKRRRSATLPIAKEWYAIGELTCATLDNQRKGNERHNHERLAVVVCGRSNLGRLAGVSVYGVRRAPARALVLGGLRLQYARALTTVLQATDAM